MDKINYPKELKPELFAEEREEMNDGAPTPEENCTQYLEHEDVHVEENGKWIWYCQKCDDAWLDDARHYGIIR